VVNVLRNSKVKTVLLVRMTVEREKGLQACDGIVKLKGWNDVVINRVSDVTIAVITFVLPFRQQ